MIEDKKQKHSNKEYVCKRLKHLFPRLYPISVSLNKRGSIASLAHFYQESIAEPVPISVLLVPLVCAVTKGCRFIRHSKDLLSVENVLWGASLFKQHLIINDKGEILNFIFTLGNVDNREPLK